MPVVLLRQLPQLQKVRLELKVKKFTCDPPSTATRELMEGVLYISETQLVFFSATGNNGFSVDYQSIVIHAVSRGDENDNKESAHFYCQLDGPFPGTHTQPSKDGGSNGISDGNDEDEDEDEQFTELRFYPQNTQLLDEAFKTMSDCAALNPDECNSDSCSDGSGFYEGHYKDGIPDEQNTAEGLDGDSAIQHISDFDPSNFITSPEQLDQLTVEGRSVLAHLESVIRTANMEIPDPHFDDVSDNAGSIEDNAKKL
ncbi:hypothetical protein GGI25_003666 [Coemansia spiralis]|uniref:Methylosome subunit pICln n=1 Tax=Coemansia spiralis TaxID=417178 RepID=A0A9W8G6I3_9FUNG|nr:hypothetical protein GGI25_003666 [Coemansia spiralis]